MFPMTITISTPSQLSAILAALGTDEPAKVEKPTKPKAEKPKAETPAPEVKAEVAAPVEATTITQAPEAKAEVTVEAAPAATYQDAAAAITKLSRTKSRDAAVALLAKFGAAKLPDVKPEQFADVIAAANEAMGS